MFCFILAQVTSLSIIGMGVFCVIKVVTASPSEPENTFCKLKLFVLGNR